MLVPNEGTPNNLERSCVIVRRMVSDRSRETNSVSRRTDDKPKEINLGGCTVGVASKSPEVVYRPTLRPEDSMRTIRSLRPTNNLSHIVDGVRTAVVGARQTL
jgi:hypothetical protein